MAERSGVITFQGNPLTLLGNEIGVGARAQRYPFCDSRHLLKFIAL